jgi:putative membrane protein
MTGCRETFSAMVDWAPFVKTLVASVVYSLIGILMFLLGFLVIRAVTPFSLRKEIEEDHNTALAIVIGSCIIGLGMIIAAAIGG